MNLQTPIGEAMSGWLAGRIARQEIRGRTIPTYEHNIGLWLDYVGPSTPLASVTTEDFESWCAHVAIRRDGQPVKPSTLKTRQDPIRSFFGWAAKRQILDTDVTLAVSRPRIPAAQPRATSVANVTRIAESARPRERTIVMLATHLGLRRKEISEARVEDWDRAQRIMIVHGKGFVERVTPVHGEVEQVLAVWIDEHLKRSHGPIFPGRDGPLRPNSIGNIITKAVRAAGVSGVSLHTFRHTCGTQLSLDGVPPAVIQAQLGHASLATTGRYTTATAADQRRWVGRDSYLKAS